MSEIITAIYERGVLVPLQDPGLQEQQAVRLQVVPPHVQVTAAAARRKASRFVLDHISYLMGGTQPSLIKTDHLVWRVPIVLTYPDRGVVGEVGFIDVDAETGELLLTEETVEEITRNAHTLSANSSPDTTSPG